MPEKIAEPSYPQGLARLAFRAPILLYRAGLGFLLGKRFVRLTHIGRKSGQPRQTVLEVVRYDEATGTVIIASGWGARSDWYRNILKNPNVTVQIGRKSSAALAVRLSPDEAGEELVDYAHRHPAAWKELIHFMGYRLDGSDADIRACGQIIPLFALKPAPDR